LPFPQQQAGAGGPAKGVPADRQIEMTTNPSFFKEREKRHLQHLWLAA